MAASSRELSHRDFAKQSRVVDQTAATRVLLLDEEGHVLRVLRSIIENQGFNVVTALNEDAAMQTVLDCSCDVLIISGELASESAQPICECASERLGDDSPLIIVLDDASLAWSDQYSFVRSLSMPFNCKAIVDCLSADPRESQSQL